MTVFYVTSQDIKNAIDFQKRKSKDFLKIESRSELDIELRKQYDVEQSKTAAMVLNKLYDELFKINHDVIIKDAKIDDISDDILRLELKSYKETLGESFITLRHNTYMKEVKNNQNFHYYGAFIKDKIVGSMYSFLSDGV